MRLRFVALLTFLALAAPAGAADRDFARALGKLKEEILLSAPAYNAEKQEPLVRAFFEDLVAALADRALEPGESARVAAAYGVVIDALKVRKRRSCDAKLRDILQAAPIPDPRVDAFFKEIEGELKAIKDRRDREVTPEGLLKRYGDGKQVEDTQALFARERSGGYATKAGKGEVADLLSKYYPEKGFAGGTAEAKVARTAESSLADPKLVDELFKKK